MEISSKLQAILLALLLPSYVHCQAKCDATVNKVLQCNPDPTDCTSVFVCEAGKADPPSQTIKCQANAKYCNKGDQADFCSNTVDPNKKSCAPATTFKCYQPGLFPDATDCSIFYSCYKGDTTTNIGKDAPASPCFPGSIFHLVEQKCVPGTTCNKVTCKDEGFFPHPTYAEYYYGCEKDKDTFKPPRMFKCTRGEKFSSSFGCQYNCTAQGFFPHENKSLYYICTSQGSGVWKSSILNCPPGLIFRQELNSCGPENKAVVKVLPPFKK